MFAVWYAGMYLCLLAYAGFPLWLNLAVLAVLAAACTFLITWFTRGKSPAFAADGDAIWLGKRTSRTGPLRLPWEQVGQLWISADRHGSLLQVLLSSGEARRPRTLANLALMLLPLGVRRARPQLLTVLPGPTRYQVPLADVTPEELRSGLAAQAPAGMPIGVVP